MQNPILFIGLGGMGINTVRKIYDKHKKHRDDISHIFYLGIDFATNDYKKFPFEADKAFKVDLELTNSRNRINNWWEKNYDNFQDWWPKSNNGDVYYPANDPIGDDAAGQVRASGAGALYANFQEKIKPEIDNILSLMHNLDLGAPNDINKKTIYLINSLGGGTGSGVFPDIASYLRSHELIGNNDRTYGVFYDPTLMRKLLQKQWDSHQGMAALVETDYWMANFDQYEKSYGKNALTIKLNESNTNWLNGVFLIQAHTSRNKLFLGSIYDKYTDMVSEYLAIASVTDAMWEYLNTNVVSRFDMLPNFKGRSPKYSSFGIAEIKVPQKELTEYVTAKLLTSEALVADDETLYESGVGDFLSNGLSIGSNDLRTVNVLESTEGLSKYLREHKDYNQYVLSRVIKNKNSLEKGKVSEIHIDTTAYANYIKNVTPAAKELTEAFKVKIDEITNKKIGSLQFKQAQKWLIKIRDIIFYEKENLLKKKSVQMHDIASLAENVKNKREILSADLAKLKKIPQLNILGRKRKDYVELANAVSESYDEWHNLVLLENEIRLISGIYDQMVASIDELLAKVKTIISGYSAFLLPYEQAVTELSKKNNLNESKFSRGSIFSTERLKNDEYSLAMLVDLPEVYINSQIEEMRKTISQKNKIGTVCMEGRDNYPSLIELAAKNEKGIQGTIRDYFKEIVDVYLLPEIEDEVNKRYTIDEALDAYLMNKYKIINSTLDQAKKKAEFEKVLKVEFGEDSPATLFDKQILEDEEVWKKNALLLLLKRFSGFVDTFWRVSETERENWQTETNVPDQIRKPLKSVLLPGHPYFYDIELDNATTLKLPEYINDRIVFTAVDLGAPLYCVMQQDDLKLIHSGYLDHIASNNVPPAHIDQRFIENGLNIMEPPEGHEERLTLYLLGLTSGYLYKQDGKYFLKKEKNLRIASTWPKLQTFLENGKKQDLDYLRTQIGHYIEQIWSSSKRDINEIIEAYLQGCEIHTKQLSKMVGLTDEQWENKVTSDIGIRYQIDPDGQMKLVSHGDIIPKTAEEVNSLIQHFLK